MANNQHLAKLQNPPVQEVVFEARWKPDSTTESQLPYDSKFEFAQGRVAEQLEQHGFCVHRRIAPDHIATPLLTEQIVHQFWQAKGEFPLVQFGPCIVTVNEAGAGYKWERGFRPLLQKTLQRLLESYNGELTLSDVKLCYIHALDLPAGMDFLQHLQKLQVNLQFGIQSQQELSDVSVNFGYRLDHDSTLHCSMQSAINNRTGNPALIWHTVVHRNQCEAWEGQRRVLGSVMQWCQYAHSAASNLFKNDTKKTL